MVKFELAQDREKVILGGIVRIKFLTRCYKVQKETQFINKIRKNKNQIIPLVVIK